MLVYAARATPQPSPQVCNPQCAVPALPLPPRLLGFVCIPLILHSGSHRTTGLSTAHSAASPCPTRHCVVFPSPEPCWRPPAPLHAEQAMCEPRSTAWIQRFPLRSHDVSGSCERPVGHTRAAVLHPLQSFLYSPCALVSTTSTQSAVLAAQTVCTPSLTFDPAPAELMSIANSDECTKTSEPHSACARLVQVSEMTLQVIRTHGRNGIPVCVWAHATRAAAAQHMAASHRTAHRQVPPLPLRLQPYRHGEARSVVAPLPGIQERPCDRSTAPARSALQQPLYCHPS